MAAPLDLIDVKSSKKPPVNVLITLDNSTSMLQEFNMQSKWHAINYTKYRTTGKEQSFSSITVHDTGLEVPGCELSAKYWYLFGSTDIMDVQADKGTTCDRMALRDFNKLLYIDWRAYSPDANTLYYDPRRNYNPWPGFSNASFASARENPDPAHVDYNEIHNLGTTALFADPGFHFIMWNDSAGIKGPAGSYPKPNSYTAGANGDQDLWDDHKIYRITDTQAFTTDVTFAPDASLVNSSKIKDECDFGISDPRPTYAKCLGRTEVTTTDWSSPFGRTLTAEKQNIANWFQYHRNRALEARFAVASVVDAFSDVNFGLTSLGDETHNNKILVPVRSEQETGTAHDDSLKQTLFSYWKNADTLLAQAVLFAGDYFQSGALGEPSPVNLACEKNFHALITDGDRTQDWDLTRAGLIDYDGDGQISNVDPNALSIADIATYFFEQDLLPALANDASSVTSVCGRQAPKTHQNVTTIAMTYGKVPADYIEGRCWPDGVESPGYDWGHPFPVDAMDTIAVDGYKDLWHAAYNSNGFFAFFPNSQKLIDNLSNYISSLQLTTNFYGQSAVNRSSIAEDTLLFNARYDIGLQQGTLYASKVRSNDNIEFIQTWQVGAGKANSKPLSIYTFNPGTNKGVAINTNTDNWLTTSQFDRVFPDAPSNAANQKRLNATLAKALFDRPLGPIVHSNVFVVGKPDLSVQYRGQSTSEEVYGPSFNSFAKQIDRPEMVYVQSNDGMVHGFDTATGVELITYLPNQVLRPQVAKSAFATTDATAANPLYEAVLDGQVYARDVYLDDDKRWASVLVGSLGKGGQGYYALDITNPEKFSKDDVLWEFTDTDDADLGLSYAQPAIGRFANGQWLAVFGNGYNSNTGINGDSNLSDDAEAVLFLVNIETGELVAKLRSHQGMAQDPLGQNRPNGFSEASLVDVDFDGIVDQIFVGDFFGNVFAFDVTQKSPGLWQTLIGPKASPKPVVAGELLNNMPITIRPSVTFNPLDNSIHLIVGTGEDITRNGTSGINSLIGFKVTDQAIDSLNSLQEYKLVTAGSDGLQIQAQPNPALPPLGQARGWYMRLEGVANAMKVTTKPQFNFGELLWTLDAETSNPAASCAATSTFSYLLAMNPISGGSLNKMLFRPKEGDKELQLDGIALETHLTSWSLIRAGDKEYLTGGSDADGAVSLEKGASQRLEGRQSWRRL